MEINVTLSRTRDGTQEYLQVISADQISVNVVLVADLFRLQDMRGRSPSAMAATAAMPMPRKSKSKGRTKR